MATIKQSNSEPRQTFTPKKGDLVEFTLDGANNIRLVTEKGLFDFAGNYQGNFPDSGLDVRYYRLLSPGTELTVVQ